MNVKTRESLSALLDDEADDLELRRILAQAHDDELLDVWQRYHQVQAGLNSEEAAWAHIDLRVDIANALDEPVGTPLPVGEKLDGATSAVSGKARVPWWGGAIAASVAFAVILTVQTVGLNDPGVTPLAEVSDNTGTNTGSTTHNNNTASVAPVDAYAAIDVAAVNAVEFSPEHEQRLNAYLMKHAGNAALNGERSIVPYARLTSFEPEDGLLNMPDSGQQASSTDPTY